LECITSHSHCCPAVVSLQPAVQIIFFESAHQHFHFHSSPTAVFGFKPVQLGRYIILKLHLKLVSVTFYAIFCQSIPRLASASLFGPVNDAKHPQHHRKSPALVSIRPLTNFNRRPGTGGSTNIAWNDKVVHSFTRASFLMGCWIYVQGKRQPSLIHWDSFKPNFDAALRSLGSFPRS
jgi:hypothetical protein